MYAPIQLNDAVDVGLEPLLRRVEVFDIVVGGRLHADVCAFVPSAQRVRIPAASIQVRGAGATPKQPVKRIEALLNGRPLVLQLAALLYSRTVAEHRRHALCKAVR